MENIPNEPVEKKRGRPRKVVVVEDKPKAKRGRPSIEEIKKKYQTRKRGRPTKAESKKPRYISLKERDSE